MIGNVANRNVVPANFHRFGESPATNQVTSMTATMIKVGVAMIARPIQIPPMAEYITELIIFLLAENRATAARRVNVLEYQRWVI